MKAFTSLMVLRKAIPNNLPLILNLKSYKKLILIFKDLNPTVTLQKVNLRQCTYSAYKRKRHQSSDIYNPSKLTLNNNNRYANRTPRKES